MIPLWILGGGGQARVVVDTARSTGLYEVVGVLDDNGTPDVDHVDGVPVKGPITPESVRALGIQHAVIAIGDNPIRSEVARRLNGHVSWATVVHPRAYVAPSATIGAGTVVFAMSVIQPGTSVGRHAILNTASTVDHDSSIGDFAHIGPGASLAGAVTIGEGAFLGTGASVIPGRGVGGWSVVGAGSAVVRSIAADATAVGVPAKVINEREPGWHRG